jgi:cytoskeletal protein CcmA (bactofilin family)
MSDVRSAANSGKKTLVEEGTSFRGSLSSTCPIEVKGRVEGDLTAPALTVTTSGTVSGKVKVGEIRSQGELAGEFDADMVQLSGMVKDNTIIRAKSFEVKLAPPNAKMQVVFGECELDVSGEIPREEQREPLAPSAAPPSATAKNGSSVRPAAMSDEAAPLAEKAGRD